MARHLRRCFLDGQLAALLVMTATLSTSALPVPPGRAAADQDVNLMAK